MKGFYTYLLVGISALLFAACTKDDVEVTTGNAFEITEISAMVTCEIKSDISMSKFDELGVLYSESESTIEAGAGMEAIASNYTDNSYTVSIYLGGLNDEAPKAGTRYYYCGYAKNGNDYYYGDIKSFSTPK